MDYTVTWGGDPEDVCIALSGVAQADDLDAFREAVADPRWREGMKVLLDYREVDWTVLSSSEIETRAGLLTAMAEEIGDQRIAVVVEGPANYHVQRLITLRLDWTVGFAAHVFTSLPEGREWLLRPPVPDHTHVEPRP